MCLYMYIPMLEHFKTESESETMYIHGNGPIFLWYLRWVKVFSVWNILLFSWSPSITTLVVCLPSLLPPWQPLSWRMSRKEFQLLVSWVCQYTCTLHMLLFMYRYCSCVYIWGLKQCGLTYTCTCTTYCSIPGECPSALYHNSRFSVYWVLTWNTGRSPCLRIYFQRNWSRRGLGYCKSRTSVCGMLTRGVGAYQGYCSNRVL